MSLTPLSRRQAEAWRGMFDAQNEYMIDTLAEVMAPLFPLPPDVTLLEPSKEA